MDKSKLRIASVKLVNGGMKGIEVEYLLPSVKLNVVFNDTYKSKRKSPIHSELEDAFTQLKNHLLDVCCYTLEKEEREYLLSALEMSGVKYGDKGIVLMGKLSVLAGTGTLDLETPLITGDIMYTDYEKVVAIIESIYAETKEYMDGRKTMSDVQIVARFHAKDENFDMAAFNKMTKEEQRDFATKVLEEQGHMVLHNDEMSEGEGIVIDAAGKFAPDLTFDQINNPENTIPTADPNEKKPKEFVVADETVVTLHEEDDFQLPIAKKESVKSSAKKKVA